MHLPILLIIIPLFTVFSLGLFAFFSKKYIIPLVLTSSLLSTVIIFFFIFNRETKLPFSYNLGSWQPDLAINIIVDHYTLVIFAAMGLITLLSVIYSLTEITRNKAKFYLLLNVLFVGTAGMVMTADLFNLYVFFEITSISSYALVAYNDKDISLEAAFKYLMLGTVSAVFLLLAIILTYMATGTLNMVLIPERLGNLPVLTRQILIAFYLIGLGVKFAIVPLHTWLPDAYVGVPITYNVLSSALIIKTQFFVLMRILYIFFGLNFLQNNMISTILLVWGIFSMLFGHAAAFQQNNLKRLLGYSTIAQMGYVIIAFSLGTPAGILAGSFHMINHGIMKGAIFFAAGNLHKAAGSYQLDKMQGMADIMPKTSLIFVLILLSMVGIPPLSGFASKWLILEASLEAGYLLPAFMIILGSFLSLGYYLSIIINIYTGEKNFSDNLPVGVAGLKINEIIPAAVLTAVCIVLGFYPAVLTGLIARAPEFLLQQLNFINIIIGG